MEKSDNPGVKEETFIQTGRRGGDWQPGVERTRSTATARGLGRAAAGVLDQAAASRVGGPTFACR